MLFNSIAPLPIATLESPVEFVFKASLPTAVFAAPLLVYKAAAPTAVLLAAVVLVNKAV